MVFNPLIAICGTTGVGKSKLAIELALKLADGTARAAGFTGARIINADAMQVYSGLDILTNKVSLAEQRGVEHLLMGFKRPGEQYVVGQWVQDAIRLIDETHDNRQVPIVVGGTSYWIQHLLFPDRLSPSHTLPSGNKHEALQDILSSLSPELLSLFNHLPKIPPSAADNPDAALSLHTLLSSLDPSMAQRWHWRDTRKVLRSLEIIQESGRLPSDIILEQSSQTDRLRFPTLCFWLHCDLVHLEPRLNDRVDHMIEQGLLSEILSLKELNNRQVEMPSSGIDYTLGIYQSIGYKEFHEYLTAESPSKAEFDNAVLEMKTSTRRYAKRQIAWIRNKMIPAISRVNGPRNFFVLDANSIDAWNNRVLQPATAITIAFLEGTVLPDPRTLSEEASRLLTDPQSKPSLPLESRRKKICPVCTLDPARPIMIEEGQEWNSHIQTKSHRRLAFKQSPEGKREQDRIKSLVENREAARRSMGMDASS